MQIDRIRAMVPQRSTTPIVILSSLIGGGLSVAISMAVLSPRPSAPPHDSRFVRLGRMYLPALGDAYAAAWEEGAGRLDGGEGLTRSLEAVARAWSISRTRLFDRMVTPEFDGLVAASKRDAEVTPRERAAMAAAWRGFAAGLRHR